MTSIFVHGFLGLPEDWDFLGSVPGQDFVFENLWSYDFLPEIENHFVEWAEVLAQRIMAHQGPVNLVGYSLGGRLLMHLPESVWHYVRQVVVMGSHLGLDSEDERKKRIKQDELWSKKWANEPWEKVIREWNSQPVFTNEKARPVRGQEKFYKRSLSQSLLHWSLGEQAHRGAWLKRTPFDFHYVYGEQDKKFSSLEPEYKSLGASTHGIDGAGHGLIFTHTPELKKLLSALIF